MPNKKVRRRPMRSPERAQEQQPTEGEDVGIEHP